MPKASAIQTNFSSGELSPLFDGRVDLEEYASGARLLENFLPLLQGPITRRGGTRFVREIKSSANKPTSLKFEFNTEQSYFLEIGNQYLRLFTDHGVLLSAGVPLEVVTPWVTADLYDDDGNSRLRSVQSGDVLYICNTKETYAPRKLTRSGATSWAMAALETQNGPFKDIDPDATTTVYASAATGTGVTLTATSAIFLAGHVGSLFRMEAKNTDDIKAWEAGKAVNTNDLRRSDGKTYKALNTATTGTNKPIHSRGAVYDGSAGVQWEFQDPGYGHVEITAIGGGGTTATVDVVSRLPDGCVGSGNPTTRWAHALFSDVEGWPSHVTFWRERLVLVRGSDRVIALSVAGDFENFADRDDGGVVTADSAVIVTIESDYVNRVQWISPGNALVIGTAGAEFTLREITTSEPFGPNNRTVVKETEFGSRAVEPVKIADRVLFVQRSGRKVRDLGFSFQQDGFTSANFSVSAPHLLPKLKAVIQLAWHQEPYPIVWALRSDGYLLGVAVNPNQKRFGWFRAPIGGTATVETMQVIQNPDGDAQEIWMIVKRTINSGTKRYVEYMQPEWEPDEDIIEAFYVDSGLTFDGAQTPTLTPGTGATVAGTEGVTFTAGSGVFVNGDVGRYITYRYYDSTEEEYRTAKALITARSSTTVVSATIIIAWPSLTAIASLGWRMTYTTISGLSHLEGQSVSVMVDGSTHPARTVASGSISLQAPASYGHVGYGTTCKFQSLRINAGAADGTAQGKIKRIHKVALRLLNTLGGEAGPDAGNLDIILTRATDDRMDEPPPPRSEDYEIAWPDGYTKDGYVMYQNADPYPATLLAVMPKLHTQDD